LVEEMREWRLGVRRLGDEGEPEDERESSNGTPRGWRGTRTSAVAFESGKGQVVVRGKEAAAR
jgi:hypothetical protein